ncbi:MAG: hypothetical protein JRE28_05275 [Deltaproteobacteria bacterium]|nr:hypothetical protein [Deltaproteobacteria bacterium]
MSATDEKLKNLLQQLTLAQVVSIAQLPDSSILLKRDNQRYGPFSYYWDSNTFILDNSDLSAFACSFFGLRFQLRPNKNDS